VGSAGEPERAATGSVVGTACGGLLRLEQDTPHSIFRGQRIYFCLPSCKESFDRDPTTSCLVVNPHFKEEL
jgi:YHS domain-containing protein